MTLTILIFITSIALQFTAAYFAFRLIYTTGWQVAWSFITVALLLMGIRRSISFVQLLQAGVPSENHTAELVALSISMLMVIGVSRIGALFKSVRESSSAIKESEERYRELFESSEISIINEDFSDVYKSFGRLRENGIKNIRLYLQNNKETVLELAKRVRIKHVNKASLAMFGADSKEDIFVSIDDTFGYGSIDVFVEELCAMWDKKENFRSEAVLQRKNGKLFTCIISLPIPKTEEGFGNIPVSILDISERKRTEEKLRQKEIELHQSQKMEALGKLTGGIAHDFNNMLGIMLGYTELIKTRLTDHPDLQSYVDEINRAGERSTKLTQKLLSFSRQKIVEAQVVKVDRLLQDNQNMLQKMLTARIQLSIIQDESLWNVYLDPSDFEDAILNLSINAMHAIKGSGEIIFELTNLQHRHRGNSKLKLKEGDYVKLSITDTGEGMDKGILTRIFEPFFSTKEEMGTGMGLSQVYGFIQRTGGEIRVWSEPGQGSRFDLYFPRHNEQEKAQVSEISKTQILNGSETVLIVDDEPALCELLKNTLDAYGYHVLLAENGKEALSLLENEKIDVVLSDIIMPVMDGYQLANIMKQRYPKISIQLMSGYNDVQNLDNVDDELSKRILNKPASPKLVTKRIRELLDEN